MSDNGKNNMAIIRIILYVAVLITLVLGMVGIIPKKYTIPAADVCLIAISVWNGISYLKEGRKKQAAFIFITSVLLVILFVLYIITL